MIKEFSSTRGFFQGFLRFLSDNNKVDNELVFTQSGQLLPDRNPENVLINNNSYVWTSEQNENFGQWIQIELKNTIFDISAYAIGHNGEDYPKTFNFSVSFDGVNWTTLHRLENSDDLKDVQGRIYNVERVNARFFKWINGGNNASPILETNPNINCFYISNLDLYGTVISCDSNFGCSFFPHIPKKTFNLKFHKINFILLTIIFIMF